MFGRHKKNADFLEFLNRKHGTKDSDHDGITDEVEELIGTDPYNSDSDNDGYSDKEEIIMGRNPLGSGKLRDFLAPHQGNNYQPLALHPQRLFFYGLSAVLIKTIVVIFVISFPMVAWLSPDVLHEQGQKIIALTNELRQQLGVRELEENSILTEAAYDKAQDMLLYQYFAHVGPDKKSLANWLDDYEYNYVVAGENLAMGFSQPEAVVEAWTKSKTHYANLIDPDFSQIGIGIVSGPYFGRDTTLIAQFFAYPSYLQIDRAKDDQIKLLSQERPIVVLPQIDNASPVAPITSAVAGEQVGKTINVIQQTDQPRLIAPVDGFVTNQQEIELNIWAPEVEIVKVYVDGHLAAEQEKNQDSSSEKVAIQLTEGAHTIILKTLTNGRLDTSPLYQIIIDRTAPIFDNESTLLEIRQTEGSEDAMINFVTYLSPDTVSAELSFAGYHLDLHNVEANRWTKQAVIFEKDLFNTIVLANLTLQDKTGNVAVYDIDWDKIIPAQTSLADKYAFLKAYPTRYMKTVLDASSLFYKILLTIAILVLSLNIFIEIKKQHPKIICYSLALIALLLMLIII